MVNEREGGRRERQPPLPGACDIQKSVGAFQWNNVGDRRRMMMKALFGTP